MPNAQEIKERIERGLPEARVEVEDFTGGGDHFRAVVESPAFAGKPLLEQHRMVYALFRAELGGAIHALSLKTRVPPAARKDASVEGDRANG